MSKMKSYAESVLFQSIVSLTGMAVTPDSLACLSENYLSRLSSSDVPQPLRKALKDVKALLAKKKKKNNNPTSSHAVWMNKNQCLLTLITELYTDVVAWNAVEQYISASQFLLFHGGKSGAGNHSQAVMN